MPPSDYSKDISKLFVAVARLEEKVIILGRDMKANEDKMRSWFKWCIGTIISLISVGISIGIMLKIL